MHVTLTELRAMSLDDAQEMHDVLDAIEDAESRAAAKAKDEAARR